MSAPELSVVVPVYNGAAHLRESLEALLRQTFSDFELLLIDDGSTDASPEIVRAFTDRRIRYIRQENKGLCHALNRGIAKASAPFVARNDQDDISRPNRLEQQMRVLTDRPDALAVFCHYTKFGAKRAWSNADKQEASDGTAREIDPLKDGCMLGSTLLARTRTLREIGGYRQACYPCDDYDLEMRLSEAGRILLLREALVAYRFHTGANTYRLFTLMQDKGRWVEDSFRRRQRQERELTFDQFLVGQRLGWFEGLRKRRLDAASLHMRVAGQRYLDGRDVAAAAHALAAVVLDPGGPGSPYRRLRRWLGSKT